MNNFCKGAMAIAAAVFVSSVGAAPVVPFTTIFGTDFASAGTGGLRNTGTGTINVTGVTGTVNQSYLYWQGPTNSTDPNANATVAVNSNNITGTNIGFSDDNFWGFNNGQAYRASTTSIINGNGSYALSNFIKPPNVQANGAATAVFFDDGNSANNRDVVIFNGNDSNFASSFDSAGWNFSLSGINFSGGTVFLTLFVSDGQNFAANDDGALRINGVELATGGLFQGDSLPGASIGNGNLFDIKTFDISSFLNPGVNNLNLTLSDGVNDALSVIAAFVDLPAGAAPPINNVPEPGTLALLSFALAGLGLSWRRSRG